jgi:hypothetical protein
MGDDDKIRIEFERREQTEIAREFYLKQAVRIESDGPHLYNLEEEFALSRRNRSLRSVFLVLGFIVVAVGATVFLTLNIQNQNRRIRVAITDFEDVTLRDLLSSARKNGEALASARSSLDALRQELAQKRQALSDDTAGKIAILDAKGLSTGEHESAVRDLRQQGETGLAALAAQYASGLRAKQAEVDAAQKQVDAYDSRQLEAAKRQAEVLNNQQRLHELEMEQMTNRYEAKLKALTEQSELKLTALRLNQEQVIAALTLKYNPVFDTPDIVPILSAPVDDSVGPTVPALQAQMAGRQYVADGLLPGLGQRVTQRALLYSRLSRIPYQNSIPSALQHLDFLDRSVMRSYEDIALRLTQIAKDNEETIKTQKALIVEQTQVIQQVRAAFGFYARKIAENGFIVDARNKEKIAIFLNPSYTVANGDLGLVFRQDDEFIGTIRFAVITGVVSAQQIEISANKTIQPFDKFLIKRK